MDNKGNKLQILALPSQTTLLFIAIMGVVLAAIGASTLPGTPMSAAPPLLIILIPLILRDFLMQPDREIETFGLTALDPESYPKLTATIAEIANSYHYQPPPRIMLSAKTLGAIFAFGTFRRHYIGLGERLALALERDLASRNTVVRQAAVTALIHEFQHLKQGDVISVGLARSTFKVSALFMLWGMAMLVGMMIVAYTFPITDLFTPEFQQRLTEINPQLGPFFVSLLNPDLIKPIDQWPDVGLASIYMLYAFQPIIYITALLLPTVWRRLLRVREVYADAATAQAQHTTDAVEQALHRYSIIAAVKSPSNNKHPVERLLRSRLWIATQRLQMQASVRLGFHPSLDFRKQALTNPALALSEPHALGINAGILDLLLTLMLTGPFTVSYAARMPGVLDVVVGFIAITWALLPVLAVGAQRRTAWKDIAICVGWVVAIRTIFHLLNVALIWILVLGAPETAIEFIDLMVLSIAGVLRDIGTVTQPGELMGIAIESTLFALYVGLVAAIALSALLFADLQFKRITLTWYSLPAPHRRLTQIWWVGSAALTIAIGGIGLTVINSLVPLSASFGLSVAELIFIIVTGGVLCILGLAGIWSHRRYSHRCPNCQSNIPGPFELGKCCPACGQEQHTWLKADF